MRKRGRPKIFKTPTEFEEALEEYKKHCEENLEPFLMVGFACYLGLSKDSLLKYSKKSEYSLAYKKALSYAELTLLKNCLMGKYNSSVALFLLKCNHGYTDKNEASGDYNIEVSRSIKR